MSTGVAVCIGILIAATILWFFARPRGEDEALLEPIREGATLLDVRRPEELARRHIPGALNIPVGELQTRLDELDPARPVIVFCASGVRSRRALGLLTKAGYRAHDGGTVGGVQRAIERARSVDEPTSTPRSPE